MAQGLGEVVRGDVGKIIERTLLFLGLLFVSVPAWAILDLVVQERLNVYDKPRKSAKRISALGRGDRVVISPRNYGAYRKVLITYKGKKRAGYVRRKEMISSVVIERGSVDDFQSERVIVYNWPYRVGFSVAGSSMQQSERKVQAISSETYLLSELQSTKPFFSVNFSFAASPTRSWQVSLVKRNTDFSGQGVLEGVTQQSGEVIVSQELTGVGLMHRWYWSDSSRFWLGGQLELSKVTSVRVTVNDGQPLDTSEVELPFYFLFAGAVGWDFYLFTDLFLTPEIRAGAIANADPFIFNAEAFLTLGYSYK